MKKNQIHAVILAGGKGTRLLPYTKILPKPLLPIGDMPILEVIIRQLRFHGITDITLATGYHASLLEAFFGGGDRLGVRIKYSKEAQPMGTAGPLALIPRTDHNFLVLNGDVLTSMDFTKLVDYHDSQNAFATIAVTRRSTKIDFGVITFNKNMTIEKWNEKPTFDYHISMGIYVFRPDIHKYICGSHKTDFPDLIRMLLAKGEKVVVYPSRDYWMDIGQIDDYEKASEDFEWIKRKYLGKILGS